MTSRRDFLGLAAAAGLLAPRAAWARDADAAFHALLGGFATGERTQDLVVALTAFDPAGLSREARLDYDGILEGASLEAKLHARFPFGTVNVTASPYVVHTRAGAWQRATDAAANSDRLNADLMDETARIVGDAARGVVPPDFILDATLVKLSAARATAPAAVRAALDAQFAALQSIGRQATHDAGAWRLRDGDAYYALALKLGASLNIDPQTAHEEGLNQVRTLSARADALLRKQGLTHDSVGARLHALGQEPRYLFSDDDVGRAQAVAQMNARLARARAVLPRAFAELSPGAVSVQLAGPGKIGYREAPSYDGSKPGAYYVDLRDIKRRPSWSLPTVVHHETLPGHLLQLPLQERAKPAPLRLRYNPNAFFEGWAIYAEELADELGLLAGDDLARLGMLQSLLVRAGRLVVDTGIHFKRWSREEAIARFFAIAGDAPDTFENEVDRIVVQPGFTAGPALGRATIFKLRRTARVDLKSFHASVLKRGQMRLTMLERAVVDDLPHPSSR